MLMQSTGNGFGYSTGNVLTTRPITTGTFGTSITPGTSNSYGSYTEILSSANITQDCYKIILNFNNNFTNGQNRTTIITIGIDTAGGTSYQTLIPDLVGAGALNWSNNQNSGMWYEFPLFIKAGSSIAAKAQTANAIAGSVGVCCWLYGAPSDPQNLKYGTFVEAVGVDTANSRGTAITLGTTSEGSWTSIGTTSKELWGWQLGTTIGTTAAQNETDFFDLSVGDGTNYTNIINDAPYFASVSEANSNILQPWAYKRVAAGQTLYVRGQSSTTDGNTRSAAAYGVGG